MQLAMPRAEERAARDFFVGVLGMTEVDKPPVLGARGGAWFRAGDVELHLGVEDNFRPARKGHPGIVVTDLDDVVHRLIESGKTSAGTLTSPASGACTRMTHSATGWSSSSLRRNR